jgi:hypothetical protein
MGLLELTEKGGRVACTVECEVPSLWWRIGRHRDLVAVGGRVPGTLNSSEQKRALVMASNMWDSLPATYEELSGLLVYPLNRKLLSFSTSILIFKFSNIIASRLEKLLGPI